MNAIDVDIHRHDATMRVTQRTGEAKRREVEPHHAIAATQHRHQPLPRMQRRAESVDQHQRLALRHAFLGVMDQRAHHRYPAGRRQRMAMRQRFARQAEQADAALPEPARERTRRRLQCRLT
jgi:hypothetical protein